MFNFKWEKNCTCKMLPAKFNFNNNAKNPSQTLNQNFHFHIKIPIFLFFLVIFLDIVLLGIEKKSFPFPTQLSIKKWIHFFSNISNFQGKSINFMPQYFFVGFFICSEKENSKGWKRNGKFVIIFFGWWYNLVWS